MQNINLYSVRIIRNSEQCILSVYLKEFFKFCGIYVEECILPNDILIFEKYKTNVNVLLVKLNNYQDKILKNNHIIDLTNIDKVKDNIEDILNYLIVSIDKNMKCNRELINIFIPLIDVFVKNNYAKNNYIRHCFLEQMSRNESLQIAQFYYDCYLQLCDFRKLYMSKYLMFALFNCARKVNDVGRVRGDIGKFEQEEIVQKAEDILYSMDSNFSMGLVLVGIAGFGDIILFKKGEYNLKSVIEKEGNKVYTNFVRYSYGHFLESKMRDFLGAWQQYSNILKIDPNNYQAFFKKGCKNLFEKEYKKAYFDFDKVADVMSKKSWIQPKEIEYEYKCLILCSWIAKVYLEDLRNAEKKEQEAMLILKENLKIGKFGKNFFGECIDKYSNYMKLRLEKHQINNILMNKN